MARHVPIVQDYGFAAVRGYVRSMTLCMNSRRWRISSMLACERIPARVAFVATTALPSSARGPVDCSHGLSLLLYR